MHTIYIAQNSAKHLLTLKNNGLYFNCLLPEVYNALPVTPKQLLQNIEHIWKHNKVIGTTSEVIPLWISQQIRNNLLSPKDIKIYEVTETAMLYHEMDSEGDFKTHWKQDFFSWRSILLFD